MWRMLSDITCFSKQEFLVHGVQREEIVDDPEVVIRIGGRFDEFNQAFGLRTIYWKKKNAFFTNGVAWMEWIFHLKS